MFLHPLTPAQRHFQCLLSTDRTEVIRSAFDGPPTFYREKPRGHSQLTYVDKRTSSLRKSLIRVYLS